MFAADTGDEIVESIDSLTTGDWLAAAGIFLGAVVLSMVVRRITERVVRGDDTAATTAARLVGRLVGFVVAAAGLVYALSALGVRLGPLLGALGIGGLALAFAAQSILANLFASLVLMARRPFRRGDQITSGSHEGTVEDVNFRVVVLRSYDGEKVLIPCAEVLDNPIVNHTARGQRRTNLEVGIAYDADIERARAVLLDAVADVDGVRERPAPDVHVEGFGESSVDLVVRFWHAPDVATMWRVRSDVAVACKRALDEAGIAIPFPQLDVRFPDTA